eukprot:c55183_g1_i1 orf=3-158(-)
MRVLPWNARGLTLPSRRAKLKRTLSNLRADVIVIQKTNIGRQARLILDKLVK